MKSRDSRRSLRNELLVYILINLYRYIFYTCIPERYIDACIERKGVFVVVDYTLVIHCVSSFQSIGKGGDDDDDDDGGHGEGHDRVEVVEKLIYKETGMYECPS